MANGDAAAAVGFDIVLPTDDVREGYSEINKSRDYLANHITSGTHSAAQITSGVFATDRLPIVPIAKGGTNATTAAQALTNLGAAPATAITDLQAQLDALEARIEALEG
jgi:pyridoxal biosynthesis lyase PdxS